MADGDCALDCMAYFQGLQRTKAVWEELREELACFTLSVSRLSEWQEAFMTCQEYCKKSETVCASLPPGGVPFASGASSDCDQRTRQRFLDNLSS